MIQIHDLEKKYSSEFSLQINHLHINKGDRVALIGSNGSGKSTLLRILSGCLSADSGGIRLSCKAEEVGYEPQTPFCYNMNLMRNIEIGFDKYADKQHREEILRRIMDDCCLTHLAKHRPAALSGGERQRMCLARMLIKPYSLLLLDEPLSAVDIELSEQLESVLLNYCRINNTTLLFSTHLPSQAVQLSDKIIIMHNGRIAEFGSTADIMREPKTEFGKIFLNNWRIGEC